MLGHLLPAAGIALAGLVVVVAVVGREGVWSAAFGPPDLGPVAFESLARRTSPNDALACPPGRCGAARSDLTPPVFALPSAELRQRLAEALLREPLVTYVGGDSRLPADRYVQRTALMRYPDTIEIRYFDLGEGGSTLALYSRSQIGYSDMGANRARLERWLAIAAGVAPLAR
jgi:uncharacterized protein (DUF1499 family)